VHRAKSDFYHLIDCVFSWNEKVVSANFAKTIAMPNYYSLGKIPAKRHVVYRQEQGALYHEELIGTQGFSSLSSLVYHAFPPTRVKQVAPEYDISPTIAVKNNLRMMSFNGFHIPVTDDYIESRKVLFVNADLHIGLAAPKQWNDYYFKNADADEMIFVHYGSGTLRTLYGNLDFMEGDYLIIPRGTVYEMKFNTEHNRWLFIESFSPIVTPKRYRNEFGQLLEHAPFCERDIRKPVNLETHVEQGEYKLMIKKQGTIFPYVYANHPFDAVGWDGYHYPYAFNIKNFEPITGRIHMPPPMHQTFEGNQFVVCSFVPRLYDYHPDAIPAPYHHSNIDSDELLYYVHGDFMSRNNIQEGQITLHPAGIPHGPHPGAIERSIGKKETNETAVMIDPFHPVSITEEAIKLSIPSYWESWMEALAMN
jgi:homogentisate 1,2-dioxygenase